MQWGVCASSKQISVSAPGAGNVLPWIFGQCSHWKLMSLENDGRTTNSGSS